MRNPEIDHHAAFRALPSAVALLTPDLVFIDANDEYERTSGRNRAELIGRHVFDVFPDNPHDPQATGSTNLRASLLRVLETGERDTMALQRYDMERPGRPGDWEERFWSAVNAPVMDRDGRVTLLMHRVEEVTELVRARAGEGTEGATVLEAELYTRARELQEINERLRQAHARERETALTLQEAMLPAPVPLGRMQAAVRYRPAVGTLNVCGDWYDVANISGNRVAVGVGDVVGHGLVAAAAMGQLRSALSAACHVASGPAQALGALEEYAHSVDGAASATVVKVFADWDTRTLAYSSAGHPPPVLVQPDGTVEFLDQATDPPLGAGLGGRRPEATTTFAEGAVLTLYTDGLIERRGEDIDTGLRRLAGSLVRHRELDPEGLADAVLGDLLPPSGITDDTALVIVRL
ncbi:PP2C family protein-serine/threonine phosphatase [Streptomyces sp. JJ36]|uniref:PP2C family protein-serine/threonine phosphatase n=1 Tax=Streptomyces sp. JJ36 TaxID=2736645 RepID=UPI001F0071BE|nr:SpoIIE family protein phosphatase [Streptomyces sp. JJ36]MCF6523140.1 SpoIIE family protein phosphatase [Streptomyces sp. JJ36]